MSVLNNLFDGKLVARIRRAVVERIALPESLPERFYLELQQVPFPRIRHGKDGIPDAYFEGSGIGLAYWSVQIDTANVECIELYAPLAWTSTTTITYHNGVLHDYQLGAWQLRYQPSKLEESVCGSLLLAVRGAVGNK